MIFSHRWHCDTVFGKERDIIKFHGNVPCSWWQIHIHTHILTNPAPLQRGPYYRSWGSARPSIGSHSFFLAGPRWQSKGVQRGARDLGLWKLITLSGNYESRAQVWPWRGDLVATVGGVLGGCGGTVGGTLHVAANDMGCAKPRWCLLVMCTRMRKWTCFGVWAEYEMSYLSQLAYQINKKENKTRRNKQECMLRM